MNRRIVLRPEAELEIAEAAEWYAGRGRGLGADFLRVVDAAIASIQREPLRYARVHGEVRRALVQRFPYGIIYTTSDEELVVLACFHVRRDPRRWQRRL